MRSPFLAVNVVCDGGILRLSMRALVLFACLLPAGLCLSCASPAPAYFGVPAATVVIDGRTYHVFVRRTGQIAHAQVIRMGWAGSGDHQPIIDAMVKAAEHVTACSAILQTIRGDSGVLNLSLRCTA